MQLTTTNAIAAGSGPERRGVKSIDPEPDWVKRITRQEEPPMTTDEERLMIQEQSEAIQTFVRSVSSAVRYILDYNQVPHKNRSAGDVAALANILVSIFPTSGFVFTSCAEPEETTAQKTESD